MEKYVIHPDKIKENYKIAFLFDVCILFWWFYKKKYWDLSSHSVRSLFCSIL